MMNRKTVMKKLISLAAAVVIAASVITAVPRDRYVRADANATVTNVNSSVNVRNKPSTAGSIVTSLSLGTRVEILEEVKADSSDTSGCSTWYKIKALSGSTTVNGYVASKFIQKDAPSKQNSSDPDFEKAISAFPDSYKPYLRELHAKYPSWVFVAENTGVAWKTALDKETANGVSLVENTTDKTWQSQSYTQIVDSGRWVNASRSIVAYYLDPRNGLSEQGIFQFLDLNYSDNAISAANISGILKGTFMDAPATAAYTDPAAPKSYAEIFAIAGNEAAAEGKGINPVFLAAHAIQECGTRGSASSNGATGYYNFYNIGAYSDAVNASRHGLELAQNGLDAQFNATYSIPWNTPGLSIVNGGKWIYNNYTAKGQYTLYYMRFNTSPNRTLTLCRHQYMTATASCFSESQRMCEAYKKADLMNSKITFKIPVYDSMPSEASPLPTSNNAYAEFVKMLYFKLLNREATALEISNHCASLSSGRSAGSVIADFIISEEFDKLKLSDEDFIKLMYTTLLNRNATKEDIKHWKDYMAEGYSRKGVFAQIINSKECHDWISLYSVNVGTYQSDDLVDSHMNIKPFVVSLYQGVLARDPDRTGLRDWIANLAAGKVSGPECAAGFCNSKEMASLGLSDEEFVTRLYKVCLGRKPDKAGLDSWVAKLKDHYTREYIVAGFVNSQEFLGICNKYGLSQKAYVSSTTKGLTPDKAKTDAFVTRLYELALGRKPDDVGFANWTGALMNGSGNGYSVSYGFIFSKEMEGFGLSNEEFITRLYKIYLDRAPDEQGFNYWLDKMNSGATKLEIFEGFVYSPEFCRRCVDAGFMPNSTYVL